MTTHSPDTYRALLEGGDDTAACQDVLVSVAPRRDRDVSAAAWPVIRDWSRATENLFSAWVERLFDAPLDKQPSWRSPTIPGIEGHTERASLIRIRRRMEAIMRKEGLPHDAWLEVEVLQTFSHHLDDPLDPL